MVCVFMVTFAFVSLALDSVSVSRKETLSASSRKEKDVSPTVSPLVSVLQADGSSSREEEGTSTTPAPERLQAPLDGHELAMLQTVGFKQAAWTKSHEASGDHDEMHEEHDASRTEPELVHADPAPAHSENASASSVMEVLAAADPAADTQEVPYYFFNFPISIKFTGVGGSGPVSLVVMDRFTVAKALPYQLVYVYPIVLFVLYTCVWAVCCMRSNRTGLSFRLICEAAACFMCLWADLATKHKVITATRAWSYIVAMILLLTGWNVASILVHGQTGEDMVFYAFQGMVVVAWLMYGVERMFVRKYYRRTVDPMAGDHYCADCAANVCCGQFTALQEAQFMAEVSVEDTLTKSDKSKGKDKW